MCSLKHYKHDLKRHKSHRHNLSTPGLRGNWLVPRLKRLEAAYADLDKIRRELKEKVAERKQIQMAEHHREVTAGRALLLQQRGP